MLDLGGESLDAPKFENAFRNNGKRADLLLFARSLVVELKDLKDDPSGKMQTIVDSFQGRPGFPIFYGRLPLNLVLQKASPAIAAEVREAVAHKLTEVLESIVEAANRQIRNTKHVLDLAEAGGLLFITNESVPILDPSNVSYRMDRVLKKKKDGLPRYSELQAVCFISEAHVATGLPSVPTEKSFPIISFQCARAPQSERVEQDLAYLLRLWGRVHGVPVVNHKFSESLTEQFKAENERLERKQ